MVIQLAFWHSIAYEIGAVTTIRQSRFRVIAETRAACIVAATCRAADWSRNDSRARDSDGAAIAIVVDTTATARQDSVKDMRSSYRRTQRANSSYSLPG